MTAERDIAGIALAFAAGTVLSGPASHHPVLSSLLLSAAVSVCTLFLLHPAHKSAASPTLWCVIAVTVVSCGALSGLFAELTEGFRPGTHSGLAAHAYGFKEALKSAIAGLPLHTDSANAIISALLTGDRSMLPGEVTDTFRASGASHILALSGMHLGIIYGILKALTGILGKRFIPRTAASVSVIAACGFYTIATGAGPSIVRAFLFILIGETAAMTGRFRSTGTILWTALLLQLAISPKATGSIGFQLSYAAMAGIAYIYPRLRTLWPETGNSGIVQKCLKRVWNSAALSIACQLTTAPIALICFGTFPKYFLMTNLIAVPLTGIIIPASAGILLLDSIGICPPVLIRATDFLTGILTGSLKVIASL